MTCATGTAAETCFRIILSGFHRLKNGDHGNALKAFVAALVATRAIPPGEASELRALALLSLSRLQLSHGSKDESRKTREQAITLLPNDTSCRGIDAKFLPLFQELMAEALVELGEYRRAIPYCEATIQNVVEKMNEPVLVAEVMGRAGKCYMRTGLRDHAAAPLRYAVKIVRTLAGDPKLPSVLLDLGNAVRKTNPDEAEQCYREVAEIHVARAQLESAAPAWVNLGVLCSEQGRHDEALEYYGQALRVRERSLGTPPERMGTLLNNIAGAHRRAGHFDAALRHVDRAIEFLTPAGDRTLANAYGTRGMILRDQGLDAEAVEWFRKSTVEHQKQPSPNLEALCEELENEAAALRRLGRNEEALDADRRLESVHQAMAEIRRVNREESELESSEGAVLIELPFGGRPGGLYSKNDVMRLKKRLADAVAASETGFCGGYVAIPETTTLLFYGEDADAMFGALRPLLYAEPMCDGSRITVRQGNRHREESLPQRMM